MANGDFPYEKMSQNEIENMSDVAIRTTNAYAFRGLYREMRDLRADMPVFIAQIAKEAAHTEVQACRAERASVSDRLRQQQTTFYAAMGVALTVIGFLIGRVI